jgi:hypothetical protein
MQVAIKACRDVCFSNGGQYFAAVNGITLSLYNTYTCECLGNLRGHNGKVGDAACACLLLLEGQFVVWKLLSRHLSSGMSCVPHILGDVMTVMTVTPCAACRCLPPCPADICRCEQCVGPAVTPA